MCLGLVAPQHVGSSQIRDQTHVSCIGRELSTTEPPGKPYSFIYVSMDSVFVILPSGLESVNNITLIGPQVATDWPSGSPCRVACVSWQVPSFSQRFLASSTTGWSGSPGTLSDPVHFSQEPRVPPWRMVLRSQDLGARCTSCHWNAAAPRPFPWLELW